MAAQQAHNLFVVCSSHTSATNARVAQSGERLVYTQEAGGSIPPLRTTASGLVAGRQPSKLINVSSILTWRSNERKGRVAQW